jgi:RNA polymerase sigma-70 factor, ECF subfamily
VKFSSAPHLPLCIFLTTLHLTSGNPRSYNEQMPPPTIIPPAIRIGDTAAFEELVRQYQPYAYSLAVRMLGNDHEAEDAVQEAFIRVWRSLDRYDPAVRFTTWLYRIVTNLCLDHLRSRRRRNWVSISDDGDEKNNDVQGGSDPSDQTSGDDLLSIIRKLSAGLPETQRTVFVLRDLQDLPIQEVCAITGLSEGSVKTNLYYARRKLREQLIHGYGVKGAS